MSELSVCQHIVDLYTLLYLYTYTCRRIFCRCYRKIIGLVFLDTYDRTPGEDNIDSSACVNMCATDKKPWVSIFEKYGTPKYRTYDISIVQFAPQ